MSLLEAVIALFLIAGSLLVLLGMFQASVGYFSRAASRQTAALVAEKTLESLRAQSRQVVGNVYGFDLWDSSPPLASPTADPDYPNFLVNVSLRPTPLYSPCAMLATAWNSADPRVLKSSAYKVKVTVSWDGHSSISIVGLLVDPLRSCAPCTANQPNTSLTVSPLGGSPSPLPHDQSQSYSVTARDSLGNPVRDLLTDWYFVLGTAGGSLVQDTRGTQVNATNALLFPGQPTVYPGGTAPAMIVMARARLWGFEQVANSTSLPVVP